MSNQFDGDCQRLYEQEGQSIIGIARLLSLHYKRSITESYVRRRLKAVGVEVMRLSMHHRRDEAVQLYAEHQNYRLVARLMGISPPTVRRLVVGRPYANNRPQTLLGREACIAMVDWEGESFHKTMVDAMLAYSNYNERVSEVRA